MRPRPFRRGEAHRIQHETESNIAEGELPASYQYRVDEIRDLPSCALDHHLSPGDSPTGSTMNIDVITAAGLEWTASVTGPKSPSSRAVTGIFTTFDPHVMLIIVAGTTYLVPTESPQSYRYLYVAGGVTAVHYVTDLELLILAGSWSVSAANSEGPKWTTERLSIEELRVDEIDGTRLRGVADPNDAEPRDFAVDLVTGTVFRVTD